jgi:uroporphyrinogen-III synthase
MPEFPELPSVPVGKVKSILFSQPRPESEKSPFYELARKFNLKVDFRPFIQVAPVEARDFRKCKQNIADFKSVVFNSRNAIDHYFRLCEEMRIDVSPETRYFCISENVGVYIQKYIILRKRKIYFGQGKISDLYSAMARFKSEPFLLPCSDVMEGDWIREAAGLGLDMRQAIMYRTISSDLSDLSDIKYDMLVFFSPAGIKSLFENFPDFEQGNTRIGGFGARTHAAIKDHGLRLDVAAPNPEFPSMAMAIDDYIKKISR